jgi:hypothetical protein
MQSDGQKVDTRLGSKEVIAKMAFSHNDKVDYRTWAFLYLNGIEQDCPNCDRKSYEILSDDSHEDRILTNEKGPWLCYKNDQEISVYSVINMIFNEDKDHRKIVFDYFCNMNVGEHIGVNTLKKLKEIEDGLYSDEWVKPAITFYDSISDDWLCNIMGLLQASELKDTNLIAEYAKRVFRPSIQSVDSIGIGMIHPSYAKSAYITDFREIFKSETDLENILDIYFAKYGHLPLFYECSLYSLLDEYFSLHSCDIEEKWDRLWKWADSKISPLQRFHVCMYFIRDTEDVPNELLDKLYKEMLNIIHMPSADDVVLKWTSAWRSRCQLAKHFGRFLESRLPGVNIESVYSQAWWMSEKICTIYDDSVGDIKTLQQYTIEPEENWSMLIWQMSRARIENSSLRHATLMTNSLWAIAILSQIDENFIDYICETDIQNKDLIEKSVLGFLLGCFPLQSKESADCIYAFDKSIICVVECLSQKYC